MKQIKDLTKGWGSKLNRVAQATLSFVSSKKFAYIIIAWFILQASFMAFTTRGGIAPDEGAHMRTIAVYAENGASPFIKNQPEGTYQLGALTRSTSYMYHYIMSFQYRLLPDSWSPQAQLVTLRLSNIIFTTAGLIVLLQTLRRLTKNGIVQNMTLFMMSNTLMFVFLAASVNYDNLLFLAANISLYYFVKLWSSFSLRDTLKFSSSLIFASLVKYTFLPLGGTLLLLLIFKHRSGIKDTLQSSKTEIKRHRKPVYILGVIFVILFGLFIERYVVNYVKYGNYKPQCDKVLSYEKCMSSALFRRNSAFRSNPVNDRTPDLGFVIKWSARMKEGIFGILGHRFVDETPFVKYGSALIFIWMLVALTRTVNKQDKLVFYLIAIITVYTATILIHNYSLFQKSGVFGLALQGRYIFPVMALIYFVGNYFIDKMLRKNQIAYFINVVVILLFFFISSLPTYIYSIDSSWRMPAMNSVNERIQETMRIFVP